jgi:hypothetical protein
MQNSPPSGPWSGYYLYQDSEVRHQMRLTLIFSTDGKLQGEGTDDIGPFVIRGVFNGDFNACAWTKSYVGAHSVQYHGLYDGRSICGDWSLIMMTGGFWIWPRAFKESGAESIQEEIDSCVYEHRE